MLNLYKLEIFNRVAIDGSFSQAAEHLLLTQPAISQHIQQAGLEIQPESADDSGIPAIIKRDNADKIEIES